MINLYADPNLEMYKPSVLLVRIKEAWLVLTGKAIAVNVTSIDLEWEKQDDEPKKKFKHIKGIR